MNQNPRIALVTADGSSTVYSEQFKAHYHSLHGAVVESQHIFIDAGLRHVGLKNISLLEVGFGTGLNAALAAHWASELDIVIDYHALELYPLSQQEYKTLNYGSVLHGNAGSMWERICNARWNVPEIISSNFCIIKICSDFISWLPIRDYNLVFFDAFAPNDQPEMWSVEQFSKIYNAMDPNGVLVTYCVKGDVKRALKTSGFNIERLPGPPGKNHMLRAKKM